jgi:hypothetical protein
MLTRIVSEPDILNAPQSMKKFAIGMVLSYTSKAGDQYVGSAVIQHNGQSHLIDVSIQSLGVFSRW